MLALDYGVQLITREEWGARPPTSITWLNATYGATRHWEGPHMGDFSHDACPTKVRGIQAYHMDDKGWTDIAYTGVVCPHGYVFEGRGLDVRTAANGTNTGNNTAYAFCYLGGEGDPFTEAGKRAMKAAMNWTRNEGGAGPNRNDHNDWKATACPGPEIEAWGDSGEPITYTPPIPPQEDDDMIPTIGVQGDPNRYYAALMDGFIRIFYGWHPGNLDAQTVWCPSEEFDRGVGIVYKPLQWVDARTYDVLVATAKRVPEGAADALAEE